MGDIEEGHLVKPEDVFEAGFVVESENMTIAEALVEAKKKLKPNNVGLKIIAIECLNMLDDPENCNYILQR